MLPPLPASDRLRRPGGGEDGQWRGSTPGPATAVRRDCSAGPAQSRRPAAGPDGVSPRGAGGRAAAAGRRGVSRRPHVPESSLGPALRAGTRGERRRGPRRREVVTIPVPLVERRDASYSIVVGRGILAELPRLLRDACPAARYAVISDAHVARLYGEALVARCHDAAVPAQLFAFPAGESNKTRETWAALSDRMLAAQLGRDCAIVALGGGVVGDVAGFVAATYLRGVPYLPVPTTLLAMIDSSIGGKTGVDVPSGKNLLGAFHQPRLVVADLEVLGSLPPVQLAAGMAEAGKHGGIAAPAPLGFF